MRWIMLNDVVQLQFLVDVDEDMAINRLEYTGPLDLARLKDHVAVRQDDRGSQRAQASDHFQGARVQAVGKWVVEQIERRFQEMRVARTLRPVTLQRAEI